MKKKKQVLRLIKKLPASQPVVPPPTTAHQSNPSPLLNLTIKLEHTQFAIGDSIPIEVTLENLRNGPVQVPDPKIGSEFQFILTSRKDPREEYWFSWKRAINERYPLETPAPRPDFPGLQLAPGARQVYHEDLAEYIVNPPSSGEYTLVVEYKEERSNAETITIISPHPPGKR